MEKVIVVITTYNLEKYISQALDSVLKQKTNFRFKILIGDDASSDRTPEILEEYRQRYPEIIELKLSHENLGSLCNSNRLFDGLQCEYFSFLDGDDYWEDENRLQKQVDFLDSHKEYMMCAGNTQYIKNGEKAEFLLEKNKLGKTYTFDDFVEFKMPFFHVSSILVRNKIYLNGLPKCYKQVENTFENCALRGEDFRRFTHLELGPLYAMPELFSYYRIHEDGMWQGSSEIKHLIEGAISNNYLRKYYLNTKAFNYFNILFANSYSRLIKYLVLNENLANDYILSEKNSNLLTSLLNDISKTKIPFEPEEKIKLVEKKSFIYSIYQLLRKIKHQII